MVFGVLVVINPITRRRSCTWATPKTVLGGALALLAVVCAARGRSMLAAVTLGLAIGTEQWALLAVLPALLVAPVGARRKMAAVAAAIGIMLAFAPPWPTGTTTAKRRIRSDCRRRSRTTAPGRKYRARSICVVPYLARR